MAIDFTSALEMVNFGVVSNIRNLSTTTIMLWFYIDALPGATVDMFGLRATTAAVDESWEIYINASNKINFNNNWSVSGGLWYYNTALTTGQHHFALTYNQSSTANNPVFYLDGAAVAIVNSNPSGTRLNGTSSSFRLGTVTGTIPLNAKYQSVLIYNRILTAQEIADAYSSKLAIPTMQGLVFAPQLCAQGNVGEGGTLAAGNTIPDQISGALGVPSGSPVFAQDKYLTYK